MKKKLTFCLLTLSMILSLFTINVTADDDITIYVNEQILQCDVAPFIENGRTMVPMRKIFEALHAKVDWEGSTQTITATKDNIVITLQINNSTMYNNGVAEALDVVPVIVNSSTFVPIRAVSQSLNASVEWNDIFSTVYINSLNAFKRDNDWANVYMAVQPAGYTMYENISKDAMPKSIICVAGQVTEVFTSQNQVSLIIENAHSLNKEKVRINLGLANELSLEETNKKFANKKIILIGRYLGLENNIATVIPAEEISVLITQNGVLQDVEYYYTENYLEETYAVCSPDGKRAYVLFSDLDYFAEQGWLRPTLTMYSNDGQNITVYEEEMEYYLNAGWSTEVMITMYAADGRTIYIPNSEVEAHKNVGWYLTPVVTMYAPDGRTIVVGEDEIYDYMNVGWYQTGEEAQVANAPSYSDDYYYDDYESDYDNDPNSGGSAVYRTPSGKRYHFDSNCGGKNSFQTTLQKAKNAGLTPCKKCAW